ncbi:flagellar protein FlgN [Texcoconibacillus texcoconensis]|uniref:Flagellar biosynthesis/type III secretory pathway chaperone n=1 Tax=Texcoconibacillus texcoconensis TaxID=1095777 RepID=A0A840QR15_9BACI|nr:flagellar protein FlgN [Texcoconibacillus texcoconensis]MBB5173763.1 flagellar biosynthesis/type III secretory pathway chaperone [Texcoconibacillus texcoconensis]
MSIYELKSTLTSMVTVHESLLTIAKEKQTVVTNGDMPSLEALMKKETTHIHGLRKLEEKRQQATYAILAEEGLVKENVTLTELMTILPPDEQDELHALQKQLTDIITPLQQQNELNQQLIEESLRFVNLSLDMVRPETDPGNYSRPNAQTPHQDEPPEPGRSLFDSKA